MSEVARDRLDALLRRADHYSSSTASGGVFLPGKHSDGTRLTEREEDEEILEMEEREIDIPRLAVQPPNIRNGVLKDYQLQGLNWLIQLYETGINGILADEMGLGKTLQSISLIAYLRQFRKVRGPHLVVVPKSTLGNWVNEFNRWCPDINTFKFHGDKNERKALKDEVFKTRDFDVVVTSFELVIRERAMFNKLNWHVLIVDEAHRLKNENSRLFQELNQLKTRARLLLTGTPLQNNLHELWALLNFLLPDIFHSPEDFDALFSITEKDAETDLLHKLHKILRPFLLRRLKSDVAQGLPEKKEILLFLQMTEMQRELYKNILLRDFEAIQGQVKERSRLLNIVMQLRKVANHPYLFEGVEDESLPTYGEHLITSAGKMIVLDKLIKKLISEGSRCLIFCQMARQLDIIEDYCVYREWEYCRIDGSTSTEEREQRISDFNRPKSKKQLFLLTTRAGGLGINLATADIVILYDSDWNPQADLQAQDRAHRIGQKKPVKVYRLVTQDSVEEKVVERAELKLRLDKLVIQQGRTNSASSNKLSKDAMMSMIRHGADKVILPGGSQMLEEDIDVILAKGTDITMKLKDKVDQQFSKFSIGQPENEDPSEVLDMTWNSTEDADLNFMNTVITALGRREKRAKLSSGGEERSSSFTIPRRIIPTMHDYQFYNRQKILELFDKETSEGTLSAQEYEERTKLIDEGFSKWSKQDFKRFVKSVAVHGRDSFDVVSKSIPGKSEEEVVAYHRVFLSRMQELEDYERLVTKFERGDRKRLRKMEVKQLLDAVFANYGGSAHNIPKFTIKYGMIHKAKGFTPNEDRFLILQTYRFGYGEWEKIKSSINKSSEFMFDYFFRSRSCIDIGRRVEILVKMLEKSVDANMKLQTGPESGYPPVLDIRSNKRARGSSSQVISRNSNLE